MSHSVTMCHLQHHHKLINPKALRPALSEANLWIARPVRPNLRLHPPLFYLHNENTSCLLDLSFHIPHNFPLPATQSDSFFCIIGGSECPKHLPLILVNNCFNSLLVNEGSVISRANAEFPLQTSLTRRPGLYRYRLGDVVKVKAGFP
nr:hypothetical protein Iba_scaffold4346CG0230 [Ipomoea batatas]